MCCWRGNEVPNNFGADPAAFVVEPARLREEVGAAPGGWPNPDLAVLRLYRRPAPELPIKVFGPEWGSWIDGTASAASTPKDYVAHTLLASTSVLIGNARWAQAGPSWTEPPHLWGGNVGDSGDGKSPAGDVLMRDVLPTLEQRMAADFPDRLSDWRVAAEHQKAKDEIWKNEVRAAEKAKKPPPEPPAGPALDEPLMPRLRQHDVTIEKVAELLSGSAPKGLLVVRDELCGWIVGMNAYNDAGRAFWIEAYGGRPYSVDRKSRPDPIIIARNVVGVIGNIQPGRLDELLRGADDGLMSRMLWCWPEPVDFNLAKSAPAVGWAIGALDRLRMLDLRDGHPICVPLVADAETLMVDFARQMQVAKAEAGGLLRSAYGKARGHALRLSLNLDLLWWCAKDSSEAPPTKISKRAFAAAASLMADYYVPMAERVYGDAGASKADCSAATIARWIMKTRPREVHVRRLQREVRLPGLVTAGEIRDAAEVLVDAGWLREPSPGTSFGPRARNAYSVNPRLTGAEA
jgi:hypothetical protein